MAVNLNETATLTLKSDSRDLSNELSQLDTKAKELKQTLKEIEKDGGKGSENWKAYRAELKGVQDETAKVKREVDLTTLTYGQLQNRIKDLTKDLKALKPGTEEFVAASKKLKDAKAYFDQINGSVEDTTEALNKQILAAKNTELTYGQLETKVKLLRDRLKELKPGTEEFIAASKDLGGAEKEFKKVNTEVDKLKTGGEELAKPTLWEKIGGGIGIVAKAAKAFIALEIIGFIVDIGKSIFETTAKFEKYEKVLTTAFGGNVKLAKESLEALKELGATTAFSVDELTDGYVKLVNRGLRPSKIEMVALTDLAASQGKTFDQLVEGLLDAATGEFERLKEFGTRASKAGDEVSFKFKNAQLVIKNTGEGFDILDKTTGKVVNTFKSQEDATLGVMTALGKLDGVGGQNAEMMSTLNGKASNLGDSFDALKVELGTGLRPVFVAILDLIGMAIPAISFLSKVIGTMFVFVKGQVVGVINTVKNTGLAIFELGKAAYESTRLNLEGAKKAWDNSKTYASAALTASGEAAKESVKQIEGIWTNPSAGIKAQFAGTEQGKKFQGGLSDEQKKAIKDREKEAEKAQKKAEADHKKHLEDVNKANEKALEELSKIESDAHIASIKDEMQREFVKLGAKRDQEAEAIQKTLASETNKAAQIKALDEKLQIEITNVSAEYAGKRRKKAEEEDKKRLEAERNIIEQQRQAENALLDWRELMAKGNATALNQIHKERAETQYRLTFEKLNAEEAAEKAKATREITDIDLQTRTITAIENRYREERLLAGKKNADEIAKIEKELKDKKNAIWTETSSAFSALLKGDLNGFVQHAAKIVDGEKQAWQKRLAENEAKYEAVGQLASAAVTFLLNLEQKKADRAIAEAKRERDEKVRLLTDQIALEQAAQDANEAKKQAVTQAANDKIQAIKSSSEKTISDLEGQYRQLSSSEEKKKLEEQLAGYKANADERSDTAQQTATAAIEAAQNEAKETIAAAQKAEKAAIDSATNAKNERIDAAEATRDAEIAAINKRKDVDQATRKQLLAEATDKFNKEKKLAEDEATVKIDQAKKTASEQKTLAEASAKLKTDLAKSQSEAELKAIEATKNGDDKAAKEILARAKEDQKEKIRLAKEQADKAIQEAENEKREKLKKVAAENATILQNKKEFERQIALENEKAKALEAAAKRKAWEAQKKADMAQALITGALATIKALASSFWPANLVFAALSAVMTGVQVAMISRQQPPTFRTGGFVAEGGRHGSSYGEGGISLIDRGSGREVGEMEGDEAIISREQTAANMPLIRQMFSNARTPSRRNAMVTSDRPPALREGGLLSAPAWSKNMYLFGGKVSQPKPMFADGGQYDSSAEGGSAEAGGVPDARGSYQAAQEQGREQLRLLARIEEVLSAMDTHTTDALKAQGAENVKALSSLSSQLMGWFNQVLTENRTGMVAQTADLRKELVNVSTAITKAIEASSRGNDKGLEGMTLQQRLLFLALNASLGKGFDSLSDQTGKGLETIATNVVKAIETQTSKTEKNLGTLSTNTTRSLDKLSANTTKSLDKLSANTTKSLDKLSANTTRSLEELSDNVTSSLDNLSANTTGGLDTLSDSTKRGLDTMAYQVGGLKGSVNAVEGAVYAVERATRGVEGAVYGTNNAGQISELVFAISSFAGKK